MSESEMNEMEKTNYSLNSNIDPKNNEELIIYVSFQFLFTKDFFFKLSTAKYLEVRNTSVKNFNALNMLCRSRIYSKMSKINFNV